MRYKAFNQDDVKDLTEAIRAMKITPKDPTAQKGHRNICLSLVQKIIILISSFKRFSQRETDLDFRPG